jgi:hypothetical protein
MQTLDITLRPSYNQSYDNAFDVMAAFYEGKYFQEILPNGDIGRMWVTIDDIDHGEAVKVVYMRVLGDFNFGDSYTIDREFSTTFIVDKAEELTEY